MQCCRQSVDWLQLSASNVLQPASDYVERPMLRWREVICFSCCGGLLAAVASTFVLMVAYRESFDRVPHDTCTYDKVGNASECTDLTNYPVSANLDLYYALHNQYVPVSATVDQFMTSAAMADSLAEMNCSLSGNVTFTYDHGNVHSNPKRAPRVCYENETSTGQAMMLEFGSIEESSVNFVHAVQDYVALHTAAVGQEEVGQEEETHPGNSRWITTSVDVSDEIEQVGQYAASDAEVDFNDRSEGNPPMLQGPPPVSFTIVKFEWAFLQQAVQFIKDANVSQDVPLMTVSWRVRFADLVAIELQTLYDCSQGSPALLDRRIAQDCTNGRPFSVSGDCGVHAVDVNRLAIQYEAAKKVLGEAAQDLDGDIFFNPFRQCPNQNLRLMDDLLMPLEHGRTIDNFTGTMETISMDLAAGLLAECPFRVQCFVPTFKSYAAWITYAYPMLMVLFGGVVIVLHNAVRLYRMLFDGGPSTAGDSKACKAASANASSQGGNRLASNSRSPPSLSMLQRTIEDMMERLEAQEAWRAEVERSARRVSEVSRPSTMSTTSAQASEMPVWSSIGSPYPRTAKLTESCFVCGVPNSERDLGTDMANLQDRVNILESIITNKLQSLETALCVDKLRGSLESCDEMQWIGSGSTNTGHDEESLRARVEGRAPHCGFGQRGLAAPVAIGLPRQQLIAAATSTQSRLQDHADLALYDFDALEAQTTARAGAHVKGCMTQKFGGPPKGAPRASIDL